jgi:hypothetical protein
MFTRHSTRTAILVAAWLSTAAASAWAQNWGGAGFSIGQQKAQFGSAPRAGSAPGSGSRNAGSRVAKIQPVPQVSRQPLQQLSAVKKPSGGQIGLPPQQEPKGSGQPGAKRPRSSHSTAVAVAVAVGGGSGQPTCSPPPCYSPPVCPPPPCHVTYVQPVKPVTFGPEHYFELARRAFRDRDYGSALATIERAIEQMPGEPDLYQFRSLVLFAQGEYVASAAAAYTALSAGPGWNWNTLYAYYGDAELYTRDLRALETATKANPDSAEHHFLLGYHCLMLNQVEPGRKRLQRVLELRPDEPVSKNLLAILPPAS